MRASKDNHLKKIVFVLCFLLTAPFASSAVPSTSTVAQLEQLITGLLAAHKTDDEIASRIEMMRLSEQLTPEALKSLLQAHPGPRTTQQIMILTLDSSQLAPPTADIPTTPAPTAGEQTELLKKAISIAQETFPKLPKFNADKKSMRFQNGVAYIKNTSGNGGSMSNSSGYSEIPEPIVLSMVDQESKRIVTNAGSEDSPLVMKQKDPSGPLGQTSVTVPGLPLMAVIADMAKATPTFLRWQTILTRQTAVFAFNVPRKQSSYKILYCCFPELEHIGSGMGFSANSGTATSFVPFKAAAGYHGELFVDVKTGLIVRLITKADPKITDFVHQEDIRTDYEPTTVGTTTYVLPGHITILSTVVPNGDSYVKFGTRRTLYDVTISNYKP